MKVYNRYKSLQLDKGLEDNQSIKYALKSLLRAALKELYRSVLQSNALYSAN